MPALNCRSCFPAFLAGLLVLATHVPLGQLVLERGIVFIDLAIAQVAGLGVVAADRDGLGAAGLVGADQRRCRRRCWRRVSAVERAPAAPPVQEAVIGVVFVVAASAELILLGFNPHGAEHLKDLLVGQILWVEPRSADPGCGDIRRRPYRHRCLRPAAAARPVLPAVRRDDHGIGAADRGFSGLRLADHAGAGRCIRSAAPLEFRLSGWTGRLFARPIRLIHIRPADGSRNRVCARACRFVRGWSCASCRTTSRAMIH